VRLGTGLLATLAALVIGLLIASAQARSRPKAIKSSRLTANIILLDNLSGEVWTTSAAAPSFAAGRVKILVERIWREQNSSVAKVAPSKRARNRICSLTNFWNSHLRTMAARNANRAIQIWMDLAQTRVLFAQRTALFQCRFLRYWYFGSQLFCQFWAVRASYAIIVSALFVCALSAASAIFLILSWVTLFRADDDLQCTVKQRPCAPRPLVRAED